MTRTWLSIRVELVEGRGERLWPRPGRIFADATRLATPYGDDDELGPALDDRRTRLSRLRPGEQFLYTFDLGDDWTHLCTVGPERIDPEEELGIVPDVPLAYWGLGHDPGPVPVSYTHHRAHETRHDLV